MYASVIRVFAGLSLIEWTVVTSMCAEPPVDANQIGYKSTILPNLVFVAGLHRPSVLRALSFAGIGCAYNLYTAQPPRVLGNLQRCGIASLAAALYGPSPAGPIFSLAAWCIACVGLAQGPHRKLRAQTDRERRRSEALPLCDSESLLPTVVMSVSVWFARRAATSLVSLNEYFILSVSMISLGLMCSYAFPKACPYSQSFWTPSFAISSSGLSLLKLMATQVACEAVHRAGVGLGMLSALDAVGAQAVRLFFLERGMALLGVHSKIRTKLPGLTGKLTAAALAVAALASCAALLDRLSI